MQQLKEALRARRGDTIVEVTFAIVIFSVIAVSAIGLMNSSANSAQASLEITMARNEINAQAEALRFIHNAFTMERSLVAERQHYVTLWRSIAGIASDNQAGTHQIAPYPSGTCDDAYAWDSDESIFRDSAFIINVRDIRAIPSYLPNRWDRANDVVIFSRTNRDTPYDPNNSTQSSNRFKPTALHPRIIYTSNGAGDPVNNSISGNLGDAAQMEFTNINEAQGIWIVPVASETESSQGTPEFFDFHIRTCWYAPGKQAPSTISTTIRLYNPEYFEGHNV